MTISPLFSSHRASELPEDTARFAHTHEFASPKCPSEWLYETNALVLAETTYLRHTFTNKSLLRRALRPLSREQTRLARTGLDKIRRNIRQRANVSPESFSRKDEEKFESMIATTLSASTHYGLARASGCRALIIQYMEQPRKYGLHGLDALALGNTVAAMIGAVHLDVKQNLGAETGWEVGEAMQALGFADVVAQVVSAWTLYSAEWEVEAEVEAEKANGNGNGNAKEKRETWNRTRRGSRKDTRTSRDTRCLDGEKVQTIYREQKKMKGTIDSR